VKYELKVTEITTPSCYSPTEYTGSEGQQLCAQPIFEGQRFDVCWQCIYGERVGIRMNG
jgi:hypothetical protein